MNLIQSLLALDVAVIQGTLMYETAGFDNNISQGYH